MGDYLCAGTARPVRPPWEREGSHSEIEAACLGPAFRARQPGQVGPCTASLSQVWIRERENRLPPGAGRNTLSALPLARSRPFPRVLGGCASFTLCHTTSPQLPAPPLRPCTARGAAGAGRGSSAGPWEQGDRVDKRGPEGRDEEASDASQSFSSRASGRPPLSRPPARPSRSVYQPVNKKKVVLT